MKTIASAKITGFVQDVSSSHITTANLLITTEAPVPTTVNKGDLVTIDAKLNEHGSWRGSLVEHLSNPVSVEPRAAQGTNSSAPAPTATPTQAPVASPTPAAPAPSPAATPTQAPAQAPAPAAQGSRAARFASQTSAPAAGGSRAARYSSQAAANPGAVARTSAPAAQPPSSSRPPFDASLDDEDIPF